MGLIGGVLNLASSIASAAKAQGGESPKMEMKGDGKSVELEAGPVQVSISDKGLSVKVDGKEVAKLGDTEGLDGDDKSDAAPAPPKLDLHSADTFEPPRPKAPVALLDEKSGVGSKPGGAGDGQK